MESTEIISEEAFLNGVVNHFNNRQGPDQMMLMVSVNTVTMTATCIGSHFGLEFLNYKINNCKITEQLQLFLSDHFKTDSCRIKIHRKWLQDETSLKQVTCSVKTDRTDDENNSEGTKTTSERKMSARKRKIPKRFQDEMIDCSLGSFSNTQRNKIGSETGSTDKNAVSVQQNTVDDNKRKGKSKSKQMKHLNESISEDIVPESAAEDNVGQNKGTDDDKIIIKNKAKPKSKLSKDLNEIGYIDVEPVLAAEDNIWQNTIKADDYNDKIIGKINAKSKSKLTEELNETGDTEPESAAEDYDTGNVGKNIFTCTADDNSNQKTRGEPKFNTKKDSFEAGDEDYISDLDQERKTTLDRVTDKGKSFNCRKCDVTFLTETSRINHEVTEHDFVFILKSSNPLKPFKCPICSAARKTEESVKLHVQQHCKMNPAELTCKICKLEFKTKNRLWNHELIHNEAKFPCEICGKKFRMHKYVRRHIVETHKMTYSSHLEKQEMLDSSEANLSDQDDEEFLTQSDGKKDVVEKIEAKNRDSICQDDKLDFSSFKEEEKSDRISNSNSDVDTISNFLEASEKINTSNSDQNIDKDKVIDGLNSVSKIEIIQLEVSSPSLHEQLSSIKWKCRICSEAFDEETNLNSHMKNKHNEKNVPVESKNGNHDNLYPCRQCEVVTPSAQERLYHELKEHDLLILEKFNGVHRKSQVKCPICKISRKSIENMKLHVQKHFEMDVSDLTCNICKLQFKTKNRLQNHMLIHNEAKFPCHICGKKFRIMKYVRRHVMETHKIDTEVKRSRVKKTEKKKRTLIPGICDVCGKSFSSQYHVKVHKAIHSNDKPHSCKKCGKRFRLAKSLRTHMMIHQDKKDIICETCGKAFKIPQGLRMHKLRYHENRDYKCDMCDRTFLSVGGKKYHMLKDHKDLVERQGYKIYPCNYCDRVLASRQQYLRHESSHVDNKVHVCEICNGRWATMSQLNSHKKNHFGGNKKYLCKICMFKCYTPWKMKRHLSSTKHIENCRGYGYSISIATDVNNKNIVEEIPTKRMKTENDDTVDISDPSQIQLEVKCNLEDQESEVTEGKNLQDQAEEGNIVEVKYYEIPSTLEDGSQIIYTDGSGEMIYSIVDGEHTYICDQDINQAVESILKLKQV